MHGAQCGTQSRVSRIRPWAKGRCSTTEQPRCPASFNFEGLGWGCRSRGRAGGVSVCLHQAHPERLLRVDAVMHPRGPSLELGCLFAQLLAASCLDSERHWGRPHSPAPRGRAEASVATTPQLNFSVGGDCSPLPSHPSGADGGAAPHISCRHVSQPHPREPAHRPNVASSFQAGTKREQANAARMCCCDHQGT